MAAYPTVGGAPPPLIKRLTAQEPSAALWVSAPASGWPPFSFAAGYASPRFVTNSEQRIAELGRPCILVCDRVTESNSLLLLLERFRTPLPSVVLFAREIADHVVEWLAMNNMSGGLRCAVVRAPDDQLLANIAALTNGNVIGVRNGIRLEQVAEADVGRAATVVIDRDLTTIYGGAATRLRENDTRHLWPVTPARAADSAVTVGNASANLTKSSQAPQQKPASTSQIHSTIRTINDYADNLGMKPPNKKELSAAVVEVLSMEGLMTTKNLVEELANEPQHSTRRRKCGERLYGSLLPFSLESWKKSSAES